MGQILIKKNVVGNNQNMPKKKLTIQEKKDRNQKYVKKYRDKIKSDPKCKQKFENIKSNERLK